MLVARGRGTLSAVNGGGAINGAGVRGPLGGVAIGPNGGVVGISNGFNGTDGSRRGDGRMVTFNERRCADGDSRGAGTLALVVVDEEEEATMACFTCSLCNCFSSAARNTSGMAVGVITVTASNVPPS